MSPTITTYENNNGEEETSFRVSIQVTWDKNQAPYVRYYEITPHFNGNTMPTQKLWGGSSEFREWGLKPWAELRETNWKENEIYYLGPGNITYANPDNFIGIYDNNYDWQKEGLHGMGVGSLTTTFKWKLEDASATAGDLERTTQEMLEFAQSYYQGWTFTVRPVS